MPTIKHQDALEEAKQKPVFGVKDLVDRGVPRDYAKTLLYRLHERGDVTRVERGKYTTRDDPLLVAPYLTQPSYLSLWTALRFHGTTQQSPAKVQVVSSRPRYNSEVEFGGTTIDFHTVKPGMMYGYRYEVYENERVPVASSEKAVVDGLYLDALPRDEVKELLPELDSGRIEKYASRTGKKLEKRVIEVLNDSPA